MEDTESFFFYISGPITIKKKGMGDCAYLRTTKAKKKQKKRRFFFTIFLDEKKIYIYKGGGASILVVGQLKKTFLCVLYYDTYKYITFQREKKFFSSA